MQFGTRLHVMPWVQSGPGQSLAAMARMHTRHDVLIPQRAISLFPLSRPRPLPVRRLQARTQLHPPSSRPFATKKVAASADAAKPTAALDSKLTQSSKKEGKRRRGSKKEEERGESTTATLTVGASSNELEKDYRHSRTSPILELDSLQRFFDKVVHTNSTLEKRDILRDHPAQAPLLAWIYDPLRQFHITGAYLQKYAQARGAWPRALSEQAGAGTRGKVVAGQRDAIEFNTLPMLLSALSTRAISGHAALDATLLFMHRFCNDNNGDDDKDGAKTSSITSHDDGGDSYELELERLLATPRSKLFLKIIDKNLKTGCSVKMIQEVYPSLIKNFNVALGHSIEGIHEAKRLFGQQSYKEQEDDIIKDDDDDGSTPVKTKAKRIKKKATTTAKETTESTGQDVATTPAWYASRKLDGVRCLIRVDRLTGGIETLSRSGRDFETLSVIQDALREFMSMKGGRGNGSSDSSSNRSSSINGSSNSGREATGKWDEFFKQAIGGGSLSSSAASKTMTTTVEELPDEIIFDGEVCVFDTEPTVLNDDNGKTMNKTTAMTAKKRAEHETIGGGDEGFGHEHFLKAVRFAKRGGPATNATALGSSGDSQDSFEKLLPESEVVVYCIFDCLTSKEFEERKGTRPFSERIKGVAKALTLKSNSKAAGHAVNLIKILKQTKVESYEQLEEMVAEGMERGWEGVMLRKDVGYEGKRSRSLLKIKQFQDAEFVVQEAMFGSMRLPFQGRYEERDNVLTNVVVLHRGNRVRVGSGFSVEDRIRFGKDPSLIIGKTITVQYFEESKALVTDAELMKESGAGSGSRKEGDDSTVWSLRFPTVKAIYEAGPRAM